MRGIWSPGALQNRRVERDDECKRALKLQLHDASRASSASLSTRTETRVNRELRRNELFPGVQPSAFERAGLPPRQVFRRRHASAFLHWRKLGRRAERYTEYVAGPVDKMLAPTRDGTTRPFRRSGLQVRLPINPLDSS